MDLHNNDRPNIPFMVCWQTIDGQRGNGGITPAQKLKWPHEFHECTPLKWGNYPFIVDGQNADLRDAPKV